MKGNVEPRSEFSRELSIGICFFAAKAVMKMGSMQHEAQFAAAISKGTEERDGVGSAREANGKTHAGFQERCIERQRCRRKGHDWMIEQFSILDPC